MTDFFSATSATIGLASRVLGFEVMDILAEIDGEVRTVFLYADVTIIEEFPDLDIGYRPRSCVTNKFCVTLCRQASKSPTSIVWKSMCAVESAELAEITEIDVAFQNEYGMSVKTAMCYKMNDCNLPHPVFICGFSQSHLQFNPATTRYLSGVGYAIGVAIFDLDENEENPVAHNKDLDVKEFLPRLCTPLPSMNDLAGMASPWGRNPTKFNFASVIESSSFTDLVQKQKSCEEDYFFSETEDSHAAEHISPPPSVVKSEPPAPTSPVGADGFLSRDPLDLFTYPILNLPPASTCPSDLKLSDIKNLRHIADGSNSNVYIGIYNSQEVIVKMLMDCAYSDPIALLEFDVEYSVLCRLNHPHIIKVLGAGHLPRRFIVLEYLSGGSLDTMLTPARSASGFGRKIFGRATFDFRNLLTRARDIAAAMTYLHEGVHPDLTVIHRDLKPDNIGFAKDGTLKILDFGLCACVKRRSSPDDVYEMSGNTGSLRFMAPEVALRCAYSEKADVYSFAIVVWQMARDRVAYRDMSKADFLVRVVCNGERPKLDRSWPAQFSNLLEACWHRDQKRRPSFLEIVQTLDSLIQSEMRRSRLPIGKSFKSVTPADTTQSSWF